MRCAVEGMQTDAGSKCLESFHEIHEKERRKDELLRTGASAQCTGNNFTTNLKGRGKTNDIGGRSEESNGKRS